MNRDEEFGYIKGQLENIANDIRQLEEQHIKLSDKMDKVEDELAMYRHFVIWIRSTLLVGAFIITMKFGDIMAWWKGEAD